MIYPEQRPWWGRWARAPWFMWRNWRLGVPWRANLGLVWMVMTFRASDYRHWLEVARARFRGRLGQ